MDVKGAIDYVRDQLIQRLNIVPVSIDTEMNDIKTLASYIFTQACFSRNINAENGDYLWYNMSGVDFYGTYSNGVVTITYCFNYYSTKDEERMATAKANELIDAFSKKFASLNPDSYAKADFNSFYNDYIGEFATVGKVLSRFVNNQTSMVDGYDNQRLQTSGVSSDEELEKMIKYQHAYNAASRYINVVSEMIEHLVTSLGS